MGPLEISVTGIVAVAEREAAAIGLIYVHEFAAGISRRRTRTGFSYVDPAGKRITDPAVLDRIRHIGIPPAWEDVSGVCC